MVTNKILLVSKYTQPDDRNIPDEFGLCAFVECCRHSDVNGICGVWYLRVWYLWCMVFVYGICAYIRNPSNVKLKARQKMRNMLL